MLCKASRSLIHKSHGALTFVANALQQFIGDVLYRQSDESRGFMTSLGTTSV
jgi:hypothetical protein